MISIKPKLRVDKISLSKLIRFCDKYDTNIFYENKIPYLMIPIEVIFKPKYYLPKL